MAKNKKIRIREETCSSHFSQLECTPAIVWDILASPSTPSPFPQLQSSGCIAWYGLDMKNADKNEAEYEGDMLLSWLVAERVAFSPYYCGAIAHLRTTTSALVSNHTLAVIVIHYGFLDYQTPFYEEDVDSCKVYSDPFEAFVAILMRDHGITVLRHFIAVLFDRFIEASLLQNHAGGTHKPWDPERIIPISPQQGRDMAAGGPKRLEDVVIERDLKRRRLGPEVGSSAMVLWVANGIMAEKSCTYLTERLRRNMVLAMPIIARNLEREIKIELKLKERVMQLDRKGKGREVGERPMDGPSAVMSDVEIATMKAYVQTIDLISQMLGKHNPHIPYRTIRIKVKIPNMYLSETLIACLDIIPLINPPVFLISRRAADEMVASYIFPLVCYKALRRILPVERTSTEQSILSVVLSNRVIQCFAEKIGLTDASPDGFHMWIASIRGSGVSWDQGLDWLIRFVAPLIYVAGGFERAKRARRSRKRKTFEGSSDDASHNGAHNHIEQGEKNKRKKAETIVVETGKVAGSGSSKHNWHSRKGKGKPKNS